jgi:hypothetical protein
MTLGPSETRAALLMPYGWIPDATNFRALANPITQMRTFREVIRPRPERPP